MSNQPPAPPPRNQPWRRVVLDFKVRAGRRRVPARLCCATPQGLSVGTVRWYDEDRRVVLDQAQRADVVSTLIELVIDDHDRTAGSSSMADPARPERLLVWLERTGAWESADRDRFWFAAVRTALAEHHLPVSFRVVTPHGWRDPVTSEECYWKRLRSR